MVEASELITQVGIPAFVIVFLLWERYNIEIKMLDRLDRLIDALDRAVSLYENTRP